MTDTVKIGVLQHTDDDLDIMARVIWGEARGQSFLGKVAVGWTIRNRVENPTWWGKTIAEVCRKPFQYSCLNPDDPNAAKCAAVTKEDRAFVDSCAAARLVLAGTHEDPTGGADHYHTKAVQPSWSKDQEPTAMIGAHLFYRLREKKK